MSKKKKIIIKSRLGVIKKYFSATLVTITKKKITKKCSGLVMGVKAPCGYRDHK